MDQEKIDLKPILTEIENKLVVPNVVTGENEKSKLNKLKKYFTKKMDGVIPPIKL